MAGVFTRVVTGRNPVSVLTVISGRSFSSMPPGAPPTVPAETILEFPPQRSPATPTYHGGLLGAGLPGGLPIQLVFWDRNQTSPSGEQVSFWQAGSGAAKRVGLEDAVQRLLVAPYLYRLGQYNITSLPTYRGSITVTDPQAPASFSWDDVKSLVLDHLIDSDLFPEPDDDGGQIGYFVMMPDGTIGPAGCGAHGPATEKDFPFLDWDTSWVAWIGAGGQDVMTSCFSHELVEMLTDPADKGWYVDALSDGELGDLCERTGFIQEGWVDGIRVRAYWSNSDNACVIPTRPLSVRIDGTIEVTSTKTTDERPFNPYVGGAIGRLIPTCSFKFKTYPWSLTQRVEAAQVLATAAGFHDPTFAWSLAGQPISDGATRLHATLDVTVEQPSGPIVVQQDVNLAVDAEGPALSITNDSTIGNFDLPISVTVTESKVRQAVNGARTTSVVVPFMGAEIEIGGTYNADMQKCRQASFEFWKETHPGERTGARGPNPGPRRNGDDRLLDLPAWLSGDRYRQAQTALTETDLLADTHPDAADDLRQLMLTSLGIGDVGRGPTT